jgi:hypothetical protein
MAVSSLECGLLPLTQTAMRFLKIGYHDYQGVVLDEKEQASLLADLGEREAVILRNHGVLVVGRSVGEGVQLDAPARAGVPRPDRRDGLQHAAARRAGRRAGSDLEQLPAGNATAVWPDGVGGAAAQARPHGSGLSRLSEGSSARENALQRRNALVVLASCALGASRVRAQATSYPSKPVRVVVAFTAGGTTDILARAVSQKLSESLKQSFVIENKPGAGGNLGTEFVVRSPPDGYTLIVNSVGPMAVNKTLFKSLPYDPLVDLVPVVQIADVPNVLVVHPELPAKTLENSSPMPRRTRTS